jgi:putative transposase
MDFMSNSLASGRKIRMLNVVDQYNRKCLSFEANYSIPSHSAIEILEKAIEKHGKPKAIRMDNGREFTSGSFQSRMDKNNITRVKIQKGKPKQNAIVERFNKTYIDDVLDANILPSLKELQASTDRWIDENNKERPHQSLNYQTPNHYTA